MDTSTLVVSTSVNITSDYNIYLVDCQTNITLTLPTGVDGFNCVISRIDSTNNDLTITSPQTIDGQIAIKLSQKKSVTVVFLSVYRTIGGNTRSGGVNSVANINSPTTAQVLQHVWKNAKLSWPVAELHFGNNFNTYSINLTSRFVFYKITPTWTFTNNNADFTFSNWEEKNGGLHWTQSSTWVQITVSMSLRISDTFDQYPIGLFVNDQYVSGSAFFHDSNSTSAFTSMKFTKLINCAPGSLIDLRASCYTNSLETMTFRKLSIYAISSSSN